ncbi:F-box only protein 9 [Aplysia californica]|uniref:F-box only protein 9 n=1 Tax=Aplysia californica TaxID=6500 RepID=A0ABM0ZYB8_APLCA|nr:F-box only protein 9 [Aplysia californica]
MDSNQPENQTFRQDPAAAADAEVEDEPRVVPLLGEAVENEEINADENVALGEEDGSSPLSSGSNGGPQIVNDQLDMFRQQWQDELQKKPNSRGQSPRASREDSPGGHKSEAAVNVVENQARAYFFQGMTAEDDGMLSEAIYYYKKALQLVPDIESKLGSFLTRSPRDRGRQDSESSMDGSELEEDLLNNFENLNLREHGLCLPQYEQRGTHISSLPVELIMYILRWVVSPELDLRSLEMFSMVCRGFYMCARDETVWKLACEKIWGVNLGSPKKYGASWRRMLIERPHMLFDGCYISRVTYIRQGEQGMDQFYRPFHLVEYYRYVRFFPDGHVLMLVSPEDPLQTLPKLRHRNSKAAGILKGHYKISEFKVTCVLKRVKTAEVATYRYKRHRQAANQNDAEVTYSVEFDVASVGRRSHVQLVWGSYTVRTYYKSTGHETVNNFDLNKRTFPPLNFSRVRSFLSNSQEPLS